MAETEMYEALVARLRTICPEDYGNPMDFAYGVQQAMCEAADAIEELSKPRWIPVTEQLPEDLERVLINDEDGVTIGTMDVFVGNEETYYEWHDTHCYRVFPTHWMPLPKPPEEET